jgi:hypothetical protein
VGVNISAVVSFLAWYMYGCWVYGQPTSDGTRPPGHGVGPVVMVMILDLFYLTNRALSALSLFFATIAPVNAYHSLS